MEFTYAAYGDLLDLLNDHGYAIANYHNHHMHEKACILRHDVDVSISKALKFATFEATRKHPVVSTYFILLRTDFYNPASISSSSMLREIVAMGHEIGLHLDETAYADDISFAEAVRRETLTLANITNLPIKTVSMHRPSRKTLEADYQFDNIINTYSSLFFKDFKYISDSRRNWREDPIACISSGLHHKMQMVTHPIWYADDFVGTRDLLKQFIHSSKMERYRSLDENFRDLNEFVGVQEV